MLAADTVTTAVSPQSLPAEQVLSLQAAVLACDRFDEAAVSFVTRLAELFQFDRVSLGMMEHSGNLRVAAISHGAALEARQALVRSIAAAMHEALDQAAPVSAPAQPGFPRISVAHAALRREHGGALCSIPIVHHGAVASVVTLERFAGEAFSADDMARWTHMINLSGPLLALKAESEVSAFARMRRACARLWQRLTTPGEAPFKWTLAAVLLAALLVFFVPLPYSVSAPARLEGSVQRVLVAAADGFVQQTMVRPGDRVKNGQVLAVLAQQDLQLERSKRDSELAQHVNAYSAAFARADRAQLVVHQAKMAEARAQLELIDKQIERTQITAPFDGLVISGDLTQSLGAPVQRGTVLMVLAPEQAFRLIVETDERDITDIKAGARGRVTLAALPGSTFGFAVERVVPLSATREGRHFFEVEGKLDAPGASLRPGLQGVARIEAERRPLATRVFGRMVNAARLKLWSWGWLT